MSPPASGCVVEIQSHLGGLEPFLARWAALLGPASSPFHSLAWVRAWYTTLGETDGRRPLLVAVRDRDSGADLMLLALSSRRSGGLSIVEFADATVCDYNLPLLAPNARLSAEHARAIWHALRRALAAEHDVLRLQKMPRHTLDDTPPRDNPFCLALPTRPSEVAGTEVPLPDTWDGWRHTLDSAVRREFDRSWRVFTRSPEAVFERITDPAQALAALEALEALQSQRMHEVGKPYRLDGAAYRGFYRRLLQDGLASGDVVLTTLRAGPTHVTVQLGVANHQRYVALRTANAGGSWKNCSPGRLGFERTGRHLHEHGLRCFDFGIGDYAYKLVFKGRTLPLFDACEALSWRGRLWVWAWQLRQATKRPTAPAGPRSGASHRHV